MGLMKMEMKMEMKMKGLIFFQIVVLLSLGGFLPSHATRTLNYTFIIKEAPYTRLCSNKTILTVNGRFPGPTLHLLQGDKTIIHVHNRGTQNITIHWHGVLQPRFPWSDGPAYITQCPIMPGKSFTQGIGLSDEIGSLWWHAHSDWSRATVHGLIIIYPKRGDNFPFPTPHGEVPIVLGEWWKSDIQAVLDEFKSNGGAPNNSDAFLINGQPGDFYNCSKPDTFKLSVEYGKTYLVRMVNAAMSSILFFSIAKHPITVVGSDGSYTKQLKSDYIAISPGQTIDFLFKANQKPDHYYMAAKAYNSNDNVGFDNSTTTAIIEYQGNYTPSSSPHFPNLPMYNDTNASTSFLGSLRSLASHVNVPKTVDRKLFYTFSVNTLDCEANNTCEGPNGRRFATSVNNISFVAPSIDILQAYYQNLTGVYGTKFPSVPPLIFNFTGSNLSSSLQTPTRATEVKVLEYNSSVEIVFQGTSLVAALDHPIHLHGHSYYVVGWGFGNFDKKKDPRKYNLVDPPLMNTMAIPINGWITIRFRANNPGVWFMHCHFERHLIWGMETVFITRNGKGPNETMLPPPPYMPPC